MRINITVVLRVDVPDDTDLQSLYLNLPTDTTEVMSMADDAPVEDADIVGYETVSVEKAGENE